MAKTAAPVHSTSTPPTAPTKAAKPAKVIRSVSTIAAAKNLPVAVVGRYASKVPAYAALRSGRGKVVEITATIEKQILKALEKYQPRKA